MARILCVDDEPGIIRFVKRIAEQGGHEFLGAGHVPEALQLLEQHDVNLIVSDYQLPQVDGLEFLRILRRDRSEMPFIMITAHGSVEHALKAIRGGADDYVLKPFQPEELSHRIEQILARERGRRELEALRLERAEREGARRFVGQSPAMRRVFDLITAAARVRSTVLVEGESGTGKELVAQAIHDQSEQRARPFIKLNCAALPAGLVESSLFGHEKGAFTGALRRVEGAFERADGGTLLLDEVSEMPLDLQARLLRVLQEREFERVGGAANIRVDVRVIATTNRKLVDEVARGTFRRDLYYRLNVLTVPVPPLRERKVDIAPLAQHFAVAASSEAHKRIDTLTPAVLELLQRHEWPGNVRELQHAIHRAVILSVGPTLDVDAFESLGPATRSKTTHVGTLGPGSLTLQSLNLDEAEAALIAEALRRTGNNRTQAAALLGIAVRTLRKKLNEPGEKDRSAENA